MRHRNSLRDSRSLLLLAVILVVSWPGVARADAIIPFLWVPLGQLVLFPVVVAIEAAVIWRLLAGRKLAAVWHSLLVNLASTLVGAALYFATEPSLLPALNRVWWQGSFEYQGLRTMLIALGYAVVLFAVSWLVEGLLLVRLRSSAPRQRVVVTVGVANAFTYILLIALTYFAF